MNRRLAFLRWLQLGAVRQLRRYYQDAMTPCSHPAALRFLRLAVPRMHSLLSLPGGRVRRQGLELVTRYLQPGIRRGANRVLPSSWGTTIVRLHMFQSDAGRTACTRPLQYSSVAPERPSTKAPTKGLSTLNSMAFGLAVYASQDGLPRHHARLASGCWSGATGRAFHPQDSDERFQSSLLISSSFPKLCLAQCSRPTQKTANRLVHSVAHAEASYQPALRNRGPTP